MNPARTLHLVSPSRRVLDMVEASDNDPTIAFDRSSMRSMQSLAASDSIPVAANDARLSGRVESSNPGLRPLVDSGVQRKTSGLQLNKLIVTAYKFLGFLILGTILLGLVAYVTAHLFFFVNRSWIAPAVLAPTDPRVLTLASHYTTESGSRDALVAQKLELEVKKKNAERIVAIETAFQDAYKEAITADLSDRKKELARFRGLLGSYDTTRRSMNSASDAFSGSSKERLKQEYDARVIDKDRMLGGELQLAQLAQTNLSLTAAQADVQNRIASLSRQVGSLGTALASGNASKMSYEVLKVRQELDRSVLESQKATDEAEAITKSLVTLNETIAMKEKILATIKTSVYMQALDTRATLAFVSYDNVSNVVPGAPVYGCAAGFVACKKVGVVEKVLEGEVTAKHPMLHQDQRGIFVTLAVANAHDAEAMVLHVGRKPLFF